MDSVHIEYETDGRTGFVRAQIEGWTRTADGHYVHVAVGPWMSTRVRAAAVALAVWAGHVLRAEPRDERIRES